MAKKKVVKNNKKKKASSRKLPPALAKMQSKFDKMLEPRGLKDHPQNPMVHSDEQVLTLAKMMTADGIRYPITVSNQSGFITAGHCRKAAALMLGLTKYPVIFHDYESWEQEVAIVMSDNKVAELADWDGQIVAENLCHLEQMDYCLELTAIPKVEIHDYIQGPLTADPKDDVVPDVPKKPKTKLGDLYLLGEHRLLCGDATDRTSVLKVMDGLDAEVCFTDPPYNIDYGNIKHPKFRSRPMVGDHKNKKAWAEFCIAIRDLIKDIVIGCVYVCHAPGPDGRVMAGALDSGLHASTTIIWAKDVFTLGRGKYQNRYEPIWFGWTANGKRFCSRRDLSNVWEIDRPKAMKPVELACRALEHASVEKDVVFDPFIGSGTTLIAAEKLNRRCYGLEIDPAYCDVIVERFEKFTGQKAKRQRKK